MGVGGVWGRLGESCTVYNICGLTRICSNCYSLHLREAAVTSCLTIPPRTQQGMLPLQSHSPQQVTEETHIAMLHVMLY